MGRWIRRLANPRGARLSRTPDGRRIDVARTVDAPADDAWALLTDSRRWPAWGPSVTGVECEDRFIRPGTRGRVRTPVGLWIPFVVRTCEPYRWTWRVAGIPATGHRVEPVDDRTCRIAFEVPLLAPFYVPVCRVALRRIDRLLSADR